MSTPSSTVETFLTTVGFSDTAIKCFIASTKSDMERLTHVFDVRNRVSDFWEVFRDRWDNWTLWAVMGWAGSNQRFTFMSCAALVLALSPASDTANAAIALLKSWDEKWDGLHWILKVISVAGIASLNYTFIPIISTVAQKFFSAVTGAAVGLLFYTVLKERIIDQASKRKEVARRTPNNTIVIE